MTDAKHGATTTYAPYQQEFVNQFLSEIGPGTVHLLLAPVGAGSSFAIAGAISELVKTSRLQRALVLAPKALTEQWRHRLDLGILAPVIVDGRVFRLLRNRLVHGLDWPEGIYCLGIDFAKRPDVQQLLRAVEWDLVFIDEAHVLAGQRLRLVETLSEKENPPSLLLSTHVHGEGTRSFAERATLIDWNQAVAELRSHHETSASALLVRATRPYRRSDEEVTIATGVVDIARHLGQSKGMALLRRAASSTSSLENTLVNWVEAPDQELQHRDALEELLQLVEQLHVDSRLECFTGLVQELVADGVQHVVTFCEYRATLDYLAAAVEQLEFADFALHGAMTDEGRREAISRFEAEGGLLMTTGATAEGLSLGFVGAAVHYDLPISSAAFAQREGRYHRFSRDRPCNAYVFEDETDALPLERILLRMIGGLERGAGSVDVDMNDLFQEAVATPQMSLDP